MGLRVVFMGTPNFGAICLRALNASAHMPTLVISQPDRPAGRKRQISPTPVHAVAIELKLPIIQPRAVRTKRFADRIMAEKPDVILTAAYGRILTKQVLSIPRIAPLNVHGSLLPRWRGAAPVQYAILSGDRVTGVSIFRMEEELDSGDIYYQQSLNIGETETAGALMERLSILASKTLVKSLDLLEMGKLTPKSQKPGEATFAPPLKKSDGIIDWNQKASHIERFIRAMQPWPGASTFLGDKTLIIRESKIGQNRPKGMPGRILMADPKAGLEVMTGDRSLTLIRVVKPGKGEVTGAEFVRGSRIAEGDFLSQEAG